MFGSVALNISSLPFLLYYMHVDSVNISLPCAAPPTTVVHLGRSRLFYRHPSLVGVSMGRGSYNPKLQTNTQIPRALPRALLRMLWRMPGQKTGTRWLLCSAQQPPVPCDGHIQFFSLSAHPLLVNGSRDSVLSTDSTVQFLVLRTCRYHWLAGEFGCTVGTR